MGYCYADEGRLCWYVALFIYLGSGCYLDCKYSWDGVCMFNIKCKSRIIIIIIIIIRKFLNINGCKYVWNSCQQCHFWMMDEYWKGGKIIDFTSSYSFFNMSVDVLFVLFLFSFAQNKVIHSYFDKCIQWQWRKMHCMQSF